MTNNLPVPFSLKGDLVLLRQALKATHNMGAFAKLVGEAYALSVTAERDIIEIEENSKQKLQSERHTHEKIMEMIKSRFEERATQIKLVESVVNKLLDDKEYDTAQAIMDQLMVHLRVSPADEANAAFR